MRKALVVGIDHYAHLKPLNGCVNDALAVASVLRTHENEEPNFGVISLIGRDPDSVVTRADLKDRVGELFAGDPEVALFYFAGHGSIESTGGYLCNSESSRDDDGLSLNEVLTLAHKSKAQNKIIVLDSCHSGAAGADVLDGNMAELSEGMSILTASTKEQYATEKDGSGVFTSLFVHAMQGAARNLIGEVTPGSVYAHIDQSLGPWGQRPVFRTNVKSFVSLRKVEPPIGRADLRQMTKLFPAADYEFPLDPSYEPEERGKPDGAAPADPENTAKFAVLQNYARVNLVVPIDAPHMWHAAIGSSACRLTVLGKHYHRLISDDLI